MGRLLTVLVFVVAGCWAALTWADQEEPTPFTVYLRDGRVWAQGQPRMLFAKGLEGQGDSGQVTFPWDDVHAVMPLDSPRRVVVVTMDRRSAVLELTKPLKLELASGDERDMDLRDVKVLRRPYPDATDQEQP